jgi:wobble nucleotide-excising tRNase
MIEEIAISGNAASYRGDGQALRGLRKVNFIYGPNGSGKTTISKLIADQAAFPDCTVKWAGGVPMKALVFNSDFAKTNYKAEMAGIFTLGQETVETRAAIDTLRNQIDQERLQIGQRRSALNGTDDAIGLNAQYDEAKASYEERCWQTKLQYDETFKGAFGGLRNSKEKFAERMRTEHASNAATIRSFTELSVDAAMVYDDHLLPEADVPFVSWEDLLACEQKPILGKKVIGKDNVDIAALIARLGNSDWVKEGRKYLDEAAGQCPFCQQNTDSLFRRQLEEYFDESYARDLADIEATVELYSKKVSELADAQVKLLGEHKRYLDIAALSSRWELLNAKLQINQQRLLRKKAEPSIVVELETLQTLASEIDAIIDEAARTTEKHNDTCRNRDERKEGLTAEVWKFLIEQVREYLDTAVVALKNQRQAIDGMGASIEASERRIAAREQELHEHERSVTSVEAVVSAINAILGQTGFSGFSLAAAGSDNKSYKIVRENGLDATETLSEGEKTFVTFLYFYHLIRGSTTETGTTAQRVVVFDDPVSSLDSEVLFVVSSLIKAVFRDVQAGTTPVRQVFVLTHNTYFHKEVAFEGRRSAGARMDFETFWVVRKGRDHKSHVEGHEVNPIRTAYELLWSELKSNDTSSLSLQNSMRRILEHYFKLIGNQAKDDIVGRFPPDEQPMCSALFAWVNDGSHSVYEDCFISHDAATDKMREVFEAVFTRTGHEQHYKMMMDGN